MSRPTRSKSPTPARAPARPNKLKAERVQLTLSKLPGWSLAKDERTIGRCYRLASAVAAEKFFQFALATAEARWAAATIACRGSEVSVTLGGARGITSRHLQVARELQITA
ncbi:MAG TPA: 4a-hydroxytetrahydrobiopterin dehydratase [Thermoanaerobaculia bacterium]|nr:4a-hydroxytetrahydrobiopterin dehydratase [Thermoanaerobaculia bacterium]